ncbi:response regulator [Oceanospirillum sediminis]|uniref:Response regulator n=1 Tax=Oceanospirillum sediminis TaxID=2760088 RepID=A0A839IW51_9GAMM|nr:response regulator [Oceanospirillum sediminis]MBB1488910.1 response regulator [Oceanospirillum sediminis]
MHKILLVEDNLSLAESISDYLTMEGFTVGTEPDGAQAEQRILSEQPDLIILDLMLPGKDGLSICRDIRAHYSGMILMFTAKESEIDNIVGLELGADDYLIKPVNPRLLLAKIKSLLRRESTPAVTTAYSPSELRQFPGLTLCTQQRQVTLRGIPVPLTTMEFDLLDLLSAHPGTILEREFIARSILGREYDGLDRSIDTVISQLRKKLGDNAKEPGLIKTVRGKGYIFVPGGLDQR